MSCPYLVNLINDVFCSKVECGMSLPILDSFVSLALVRCITHCCHYIAKIRTLCAYVGLLILVDIFSDDLFEIQHRVASKVTASLCGGSAHNHGTVRRKQ